MRFPFLIISTAALAFELGCSGDPTNNTTSTSSASSGDISSSSGAGGSSGSGSSGTGGTGGSTTCQEPCSGDIQWVKRFGDAAMQLSLFVNVDNAGDIVFVGYFTGTVDFGGGSLTSAGGEDFFVAKLDPDGKLLWAQRFGGAALDTVGRLAVDAQNNIIISGSFGTEIDFGATKLVSAGSSDLFVAKLDPGGGALWAKRFGDTAAQGEYDGGVAVNAAGDIYLVSDYRGTIDMGFGPLTSKGDLDIVVAKLNASGTSLWAKSVGGPATDYAGNIALKPDGSVVVAGTYETQLDAFGQVVMSKGGRDIYTLQLDAAGALLSLKGYGSPLNDYNHATSAQAFVGEMRGPIDFGSGVMQAESMGDSYIAAYAADGSVKWAKIFGGPSEEWLSGVTEDANGNEIITGMAKSPIDFGGGTLPAFGDRDVVIAKLSPTGDHLWSKRYGGPSIDMACTAAAMADGSVIVTGALQGSVDFGTGVVTSAGDYDGFILKLSP